MASTLKMPRKTVMLTFDDVGYPGFQCECWLNIPAAHSQAALALRNGRSKVAEKERATRFWLMLFPAWNFTDFDGTPIPQTAQGIDLIPDDLASAMMAKRAQALRDATMPAPLDGSSSDVPSGLAEASQPLTTN